MSTTPQAAYLETQILTATPQKLRLMLIEGAIRFANQTLLHWKQDRQEEALESLMRCRGVITELLVSIRSDQSELMRKVAGIYVFLFQTLTKAQFETKPEYVKEVVKVLEVERETWQEVCEKMPEAPDPALMKQSQPKEITASNSEAIAPAHLPTTPSFDSNQFQSDSKQADRQTSGFPLPDDNPTPAPGGFSLDA